MKAIEMSCLLLSGAAMTGALLLGTLSSNAHAATATTKTTVPQEAIEACKGKKEGDKVDLPVGNGKTAKAICRKAGNQLVAMRTASIGP